MHIHVLDKALIYDVIASHLLDSAIVVLLKVLGKKKVFRKYG